MDSTTTAASSSSPTVPTSARPSPSRAAAAAAAKDISSVVLGRHLMQTWYSSSYPKKLVRDACSKNGRLYVCEYCFKYTPDLSKAVGHQVYNPHIPPTADPFLQADVSAIRRGRNSVF